MGSLLADYLLRKLQDVEIALSDLESSAAMPEELTELERLTALQDDLARQLRAVVGHSAQLAGQRAFA